MLAIQLDDRSPFLTRWPELLLGVLTPEALAADPGGDPAERPFPGEAPGAVHLGGVQHGPGAPPVQPRLTSVTLVLGPGHAAAADAGRFGAPAADPESVRGG